MPAAKENATFPAGCRPTARDSAGEPGRHLALARRGESNNPRSRLAHRPAAREDFLEDGCAEGSTEMVSALAPIKTAPAERPPPAAERSDVEAARGEEAPPLLGQVQGLDAPQQQTACDEADANQHR